MARAHIFRPITDAEGNLRYGAKVTVQEASVSAEIAQTLYVSPTGTATLSNPFIADGGLVDFWLDSPQRVSLLVQNPGNDDTLVYLDAQPPAEEIVQSEIPLRITNSPNPGNVLTATAVAGEAQWELPDLSAGLTNTVAVLDESFETGTDPSGWVFTDAGGASHAYSGDVPVGMGFLHSLRMTGPASSTNSVLTPTFTLVEQGRVQVWVKSSLPLTERWKVQVKQGSTFLDIGITDVGVQDWAFYTSDEIKPGTYALSVSRVGSSDVTTHDLFATGAHVEYGGNVPTHYHDGGGTNSTALGQSAVASASGSVAVGDTAQSTGASAVAVGYGSQALGAGSVAAGGAAVATAANSIAVGNSAAASAGSGDAIAVGHGASATRQYSIAIGASAAAGDVSAVAIGQGASAPIGSTSALAIGDSAQVLAPSGVALGAGASVGSGHDNAVALGAGVASTGTNEVALGDSRHTVVVMGALRSLGDAKVGGAAGRVGFFGQAGTTKPVVTGNDGGDLALRALLVALANFGLITNSTTAGP